MESVVEKKRRVLEQEINRRKEENEILKKDKKE